MFNGSFYQGICKILQKKKQLRETASTDYLYDLNILGYI